MTQGEHVDGFIVVCKDEDPSRENKNMSMYLVPANAPGVTIEPLNKIGMQIMPFAMIHFDEWSSTRPTSWASRARASTSS